MFNKKEYNKKWKKENRDRVNAWNRAYKDRNREFVKSQARAYALNFRLTKQQLYMFTHLKAKAKRLKIPFGIDVEDIIIPEICPVLGIPIKYADRGFDPNSASVDRIIPELGYTKGNIRVISQRANWLKRDGTPDELAKVAAYSHDTTRRLVLAREILRNHNPNRDWLIV